MRINNNFSSNGTLNTRKQRIDNPIVCLYESILNQRGVHIKPMTELSFKTCYNRYKQIGGRREFEFNVDYRIDNLI